MKKSLFDKLVKMIKSEIDDWWTYTKTVELDTTEFRFPNDISISIKHRKEQVSNWSLQIDYNRSDEDGKTLPVNERSATFYYKATTQKGLELTRDVHVYPSTTAIDNNVYTMYTTVRVSGWIVAEFKRELHLTQNGGHNKDMGVFLYRSVFRP